MINQPFAIESDASDYVVAAILSQGGRPVAYMSRTLNTLEKNYPAIEKEANANHRSRSEMDLLSEA